MKSKKFKLLLLLFLFLLPVSSAQAFDAKTGDNIHLPEDEIIGGNLFATGQTITIDGAVSGDLIAMAQNIDINGRVEGDIIALVAQSINVNGNVGGNIRVAGNSIILNGEVVRNVNAFGSNIVFGKNAHVGWDAFLAGNNIEMRGKIDGSLNGYANKALIAGELGENVSLKNNNLTISGESIINGNVIYVDAESSQISEQASISGEIKQKEPTERNREWLIDWAWDRLFAIFGALVVGLVLVFIFRKISLDIIQKIREKPRNTILPGIILMLAAPVLAFFLFFTIIGAPLALALGAIWLIAIYLAKILTALLVGKLIINLISKKKEMALHWQLTLGVLVCWLLFSIPFVGWMLSLIAAWLGLGGIYQYASNKSRNI